ncbi:MAG: hypothetical protein U0470_09070 [Anaerolineae bacterium]
MRGLQVIVMADVAEQSDEIDLARAERARQEALDALAKRAGAGRAAGHGPRAAARRSADQGGPPPPGRQREAVG